jgi:hypothetical protein
MNMFKERLIIFAVVLTAFLTAGVYFIPSKEESKYREKIFWINKTHTQKKYDWVFIGDSRVYRGISPAAINEVIPDIDILNFGYSSGSLTSNMLNAAEEKLDMESPARTLVIGFAPHTLTPRAAMDEHYLQEKNRKREEIIDARYFGAIKQLFVSTTIYELYLEILRSFKKEKKVEDIYYQEFQSNGWVASWKTFDDPENALASYRSGFVGNQVSDSIFGGFLSYVKKWVAEGIKVYAFRPPTTIKMVQVEDSLSGFNEVKIRSAFEQAGGIWINVENGFYRSYDGSHLHKEAAIRLSKDLAIHIRKSDPRWNK